MVMNRIKLFLWEIGIIKNCPFCGDQLIEHGYTQQSATDTYYTCKKIGCKFND